MAFHLSSSASTLLRASSMRTKPSSLLVPLVASFSTSAFQYPRPVYIRSVGAYLPNDPVTNEELEHRIGALDDRVGIVRDKILSLNGIETRHYAMKDQGKPTHLNLDLAAEAAKDALRNSDGISLQDIGMLATGTTLPDVLIPGFANLVHGRLGSTSDVDHSMDCLSSSGVCCSSTNALKAAVNAVALGQHDNALVIGSETASHGLHAQHMKRFQGQHNNIMSGLFLRYMLSDGAGCVLLDTNPHPTGLSYQVDAFHHHSFANRFPPCMIGGVKNGPGKHVELEDIWKFNDDHTEVPLRLEQDIDLLKNNIIPLGKEALQYAMEHQKLPIAKGDVDWVVPHLSSLMFFPEFCKQIHGVLGVEKEQIWTNLSKVGNVGAASMPLLLWGMLNHNPNIKKGDRVLVIVPESGNFSYHYILLTVV